MQLSASSQDLRAQRSEQAKTKQVQRLLAQEEKQERRLLQSHVCVFCFIRLGYYVINKFTIPHVRSLIAVYPRCGPN